MPRRILTALSIILIFFYSKGFSQSSITAGPVSGNWTVGGSPYLILGDINVPQDCVLVINPGVIIEFQGHYKMVINGSLKARGSGLDSIHFKVSSGLISSGWGGVRFNSISTTQDSSIIEYCTIKNGKANGSGADSDGGGIFIYNCSKVRISHNTISKNSCSRNGGGLYFTLCSPIIAFNTIKNNSSVSDGAGICGLSATSSNVSNNVITLNTSSANAGGIYAGPSTTLKIMNNTITNNNAINGGGIYLGSNSVCVITNNSINNNNANSSNGTGGGIGGDYAVKGSLLNNTINYNSARNGAGIGLGASSAAQIINNSIGHNSAYNGGGIRLGINSSVYIESNIIEYNFCSYGSGGAIDIDSSPTGYVKSNNIRNNSAYNGGGIAVFYNQMKIENNIIENNTASGKGGGVCLVDDTQWSILSGNTITGNTSTGDGGGIYGDIDYTQIIGNVISGNTGGIYLYSYYGSGINYSYGIKINQNYITNNSQKGGVTLNVAGAEFKSNIICNNSNDNGGGGVTVINTTFFMLNSTIANNKSNSLSDGGGGIYCSLTSKAKFINCIVRGNIAASGYGHQIFLKDSDTDPNFENCDIEGGNQAIYTNGYQYTGTYSNNLDTVPLFIAPSAGAGTAFNGYSANWQLEINSSCVNTGKTSYYSTSDKDVIGVNRKIDIGIDIGAYEFDSCFQATIDTNLIYNGSTLSSLQTTASFYKWLNCDSNYIAWPDLANSPVITPTVGGSYAVEINRFGCIDTSMCIDVSFAGIETEDTPVFQIFPNPVVDKLYVICEQLTKKEINVFNQMGNKIRTFNEVSNEVNMSDLPAGIYFIQIVNDKRIVSTKVIKL